MKLQQIEGIGDKYAEQLKNIGIGSLNTLLKKGATAKGRKKIEADTGISGKLILEWVNLADLFRIKGIGSEFSDLLEEAGVDTVAELAQRVPDNLHAKMLEVNNAKKLVRQFPSMSMIKSWIEQAKNLPRVIEY